MKNIVLSFAFLFLLSNIAQSQTGDSLKNTIGLQLGIDDVSKPNPQHWQMTSLEYQRKANKVTFLGRLNYATRYNRSGWQAEVEAYPKISKKVYAYVGGAYSADAPVFPKWRGGASAYVNLSKGWEAEGGMRYLFFDKSNVIGVLGVSKYAGKWLLNLRSFASFTNDLQDPSLFLSARHYLKHEKDYFWLQLGSGISPDERRNIQLAGHGSLSSKLMLLGLRRTVYRNFVGMISAGYAREEWMEGIYVNRRFGTISVQYHF